MHKTEGGEDWGGQGAGHCGGEPHDGDGECEALADEAEDFHRAGGRVKSLFLNVLSLWLD